MALWEGYSDYLVAPDEAIATFYGNGYASAMQVIQMTARRCAEVTLQHGYRYFVGTAASDASSNYSFTTPGYASTYGHGSAVGYGNYASGSFSSNTIITPPQTYNVHKPALTIAIKMSNNEKSLEPYGMVMAGVKARPSDAAFLIQSLPKSRQIAPAVENRRARMARGRSLSAFVPGSNKMLHPFEENLTESRILLRSSKL